MAKAPIIDGRTAEEVLTDLFAHAPGHTPGWRPAEGTAAHALLSVFSRMIALEGDALDQVPDRSRLSFLDTLGNSLLSAQSARAAVVFTLMDAAPLDVTLPVHTQVAAKLPPAAPLLGSDAPPPPPATLFFVEQTVALTRGRLGAAYSVNPAADTYRDHSSQLSSGFSLFEGLGPVPHALYIGHGELFQLTAGSQITLSFDVAPAHGSAAPAPLVLEWEFYSSAGWRMLEILEDDTARLTRDGKIVLRVSCSPEAKEETFGGVKSYWIRAVVSARGPMARVGALPAGWHIKVGPPASLAAAPPITVDGVASAIIVAINGRELTISQALPGARAGALIRHGVNGTVLAEIAAVRDETHIVVVGVDPGRTITIDQHSSACVIGAGPGVSVLNLPLGGSPAAGAQLLDVATGRSLGSLVQALPHFRVPIVDRSAFLPGDVVTVDGNSRAIVTGASTTFLLLDASIGKAVAGADVVLADAKAPLAHEGAGARALPILDVIRAQVAVTKAGLAPDAAANDSVPIDVRTIFRPFGAQPATLTSFYVASEEVFKRIGARVSLSFKLASPGKGFSNTGDPGVGGGKLEWAVEYFDGTGWKALGDADELLDDTIALTAGKANDTTQLSFVCPADWTKVDVNGTESLWLRIRISSGNYGSPLQVSSVTSGGTTTLQVTPETLAPPVLAGLWLGYAYRTRIDRVEHCLTLNDFTLTDRSDDARWANRPFAPFTPLADEGPAVHLGFTEKPPAGVVSLFATVPLERTEDADAVSPFVWEYFGARGWTELAVADETIGFTHSGVIQFVGPSDAQALDGLGGLLYRIRARLKPGVEAIARPLAGIWLNGVWVRQGERIVGDTLGISNGNPWQTLVFPPRRIPVMPGEIIEVREWTGRGEDWETAVAGVPSEDLRFELDPRDGRTPVAVWVRWHERAHLFDSRPHDRHYAIERSVGILRFAAAPFAMIPPAGARIVATYTTGGDVTGNVPAHTITELRSGIGYVRSITNPMAAAGGTAVEQSLAAVGRSTARLANRNRAVRAADYEWMAYEASPEVARVRCLPLEGPEGTPLRGWVTLVIVPHTADPAPRPTPDLIGRVLTSIRARVPAGVGPRVRVATPTYVTLSVRATIVLTGGADVAAVEAELRRSLARFLHPLTGGTREAGFAFGESIYLSDFASLIEGIGGVDFVRRLDLHANGAVQGDAVRLPVHALPTPGDHALTLALGVA